ncbi:MAG TPA: glycosyltransferase [Candidatus Thermoplasmatota archaeon]|nr:glycosyltransferase [Candidatus Thermoplasmatota archaeon]
MGVHAKQPGQPLVVALFANELPELGEDLRVAGDRPFGGVQMATLALAHALARAGTFVHVFASAPQAGTLEGERGRLQVHLARPRAKVGEAPFAPGLFRAARPDPAPTVVLAQMGSQPAPWAAMVCARRWKVPLVVTHHGDYVSGFGSPLRRLAVAAQTRHLGPRILRRAAAVIALSHAVVDASPLLAPVLAKVHVIPNGIDPVPLQPGRGREALRRELGIPPGAPVALFVGALNPIKGVDVLLAAWAEVARSLPDAHLLVLGDGPYRHEYEAQATALGLAGRVRFAGFVHKGKGDHYAASDILVLPSRSETFPLVVLEAGACGLPVVASDLPQLRAMVGPDNGILVPPGDAAALAQALVGVLADAALRARLGAANHQRSAGQTWDAVAQRTLEVLRGTVGASP